MKAWYSMTSLSTKTFFFTVSLFWLDLYIVNRVFVLLSLRIVFEARGTERRPRWGIRSLLPPARTRKVLPAMRHVRVCVYVHLVYIVVHCQPFYLRILLYRAPARVLDRVTLRVYLVARDAADRFGFRSRRGRPILRRRAPPILPSVLARVRRGHPGPYLGSREARDRRRRVLSAENTKVRAVGGRVAAPCAGASPAVYLI